MQTDFKKNHFELFGLPPAFALDPANLDRIFRVLQSEVHPDRFAAASDAEKRLAMQWATRVNEAYQTLKKPLSRARYLLGLQGVDTQEESNTSMPADFLMRQMEWREQAAEASANRDLLALEALALDLSGEAGALRAGLEERIAMRDWPEAALLVRKLRFIEKLEEEINFAFETIGA